jgi:hypothetical protein
MALSLYRSNEGETPPQICRAFIEETYHNIPDFWELWMRLRYSLTRNALFRDQEIIAWLNLDPINPVLKVTGNVLL